MPCLKDYSEGEAEDWIHVRCQPGAFLTEDAATPIPPDGHIKTFFGTLADQPLPYTFTLEYEVRPGEFKRMYCTRTVNAANDFEVDLEGDGSGTVKCRTGAWSVTLNDCPPAGAVMRVRYIPVSTCAWSWVETPETIEGGEITTEVSTIKEGWIVVDEERKVAHGDPRPCAYRVDVSAFCAAYIDARGHIMGWYKDIPNPPYWEWYSPWGHPEPS